MAALGLVQFNEFPQNGSRGMSEVRSEGGLWFGGNMDKDSWERARAVGKVKKPLMIVIAREGRKDIERDFKRARCWRGGLRWISGMICSR